MQGFLCHPSQIVRIFHRAEVYFSVLENRFSVLENRFSANGVFLENGFSRIALLSEKIGSLLTNQREASVKPTRSLCEINKKPL